nr:hypothetical protein CFP56_66678 [Quercus suber]
MEVSSLIARIEKVSCKEAIIELPPNQDTTTSPKLILLAKLITNKDIGLAFVRDVVLKAWNPVYPLKVKRMDKDIFMFSFSHEVNAQRAYHKRPWSCKGGHLILKKWSPEVTWQEVEFSSSTFWVQVHGLPALWNTKDNLRKIDVSYKCGVIGHEERSCTGTISQLCNSNDARFKVARPWLRLSHNSLLPGVFVQPDGATTMTRESSGQSSENESRSVRDGMPERAPPTSYNLHQVPCTSPLPSQDTWHSHDILTFITSVGLRSIEELAYPSSAQNPNYLDHAYSPTCKQMNTQSSTLLTSPCATNSEPHQKLQQINTQSSTPLTSPSSTNLEHHQRLQTPLLSTPNEILPPSYPLKRKVTEKELEVFAKCVRIAASGQELVYFDPKTVALIPQSSLEYFIIKESQKAEDEAHYRKSFYYILSKIYSHSNTKSNSTTYAALEAGLIMSPPSP